MKKIANNSLFGIWLKDLREKSGRTNQEIAEATGYKTGKSISQVISGKINFKPEYLANLCLFLNASLEEGSNRLILDARNEIKAKIQIGIIKNTEKL